MNNLPLCYDPESMTPARREEVLKQVYQALYPWHGTHEARSYDYPPFTEAVNMWAGDDFYRQHLTAVLYLQDIANQTRKAVK